MDVPGLVWVMTVVVIVALLLFDLGAALLK